MIALGITLAILVFVAFLLLGAPVAFAVVVSAVVALLGSSDVDTLTTVSQRMAAGVDSFALLAIPFFILAGNVMAASGTAKRLIDAARVLVGWLPGGMSLVNVLSCMLFGAISGSAAAAISSIGGLMVPALEDEGEQRTYATALTTTAATTGLLIPPSNVMIVYAVVAQTSIAALFFGGILPGVLVGVLLMGAALVVRRPDKAKAAEAAQRAKFDSPVQALVTVLLAIPSLSLIVFVLGGILGGVFSATEAAAVSVLLALVVGLLELALHRGMKWDGPCLRIRGIPSVVFQSAKTTAIVMFLIAASQAMSWVLSYLRIPQVVAEQMLSLTTDKVMLLLIMNMTLLIVGTFLDITPGVLIFTPIFLPISEALGLHPAHFGIILILNLSIGLCTPPVGTCLFLGCSVGKVSISQVTRPMLPFFGAMIAALVLVTAFPSISLWIPERMGLVDPIQRDWDAGAPAARVSGTSGIQESASVALPERPNQRP